MYSHSYTCIEWRRAVDRVIALYDHHAEVQHEVQPGCLWTGARHSRLLSLTPALIEPPHHPRLEVVLAGRVTAIQEAGGEG